MYSTIAIKRRATNFAVLGYQLWYFFVVQFPFRLYKTFTLLAQIALFFSQLIFMAHNEDLLWLSLGLLFWLDWTWTVWQVDVSSEIGPIKA